MQDKSAGRNIVVFSDGTGNSAASFTKTNVWRMYRALDTRAESNQVSYYDDGVGTSPFRPKEILGQITGWGLASNVKNIYSFLCRSYRPGDSIYGFGFSRGAYTMRVVMALVACEGLIDRSNMDEHTFNQRVNQAFKSFRQNSFTASLLSFPWRMISSNTYESADNIRVKVKFLGVWDTVDAYGLPIDELRRAWDMVVWPLTGRDRDCPPNIEQACHALALDEQRLSFSPTLWNERTDGSRGDIDEASAPKTRITQVWFPGVHANIGGGYPDDTLALVSLRWMQKQAESSGLKFIRKEIDETARNANINGPIADSRSGVGFLYRLDPRHIESLCRQKSPGLANWLKIRFDRIFPKNTERLSNFAESKLPRLHNQFKEIEENVIHIETPKIHYSVLDRIREPANNYAPLNLPGVYEVVDDDNRVIDTQKGESVPSRRALQSAQWNLVGLRKIIYIVNLGLIIATVAYGLNTFSSFNPLAWEKIVLLPIVTVVALVFTGGKLKSKLNRNLLKIWHSAKQFHRPEFHRPEIVEQAVKPVNTLFSRRWLDNIIDDNNTVDVAPGARLIRVTRIATETAAVVALLFGIGVLFYRVIEALGKLFAL